MTSTNQNQSLYNGRYQIIKRIARGMEGIVFLVKDIRDETKKAMKQISNEIEIMRESTILQRVGSECSYIIKYLDCFEHSFIRFIVLEYHECGNLDDFIKKVNQEGKKIPTGTIRNWSRQLLEASAFIHSKSIIHRDIKPLNILLSSYDSLILADFGVAAHTESMRSTFVGSFNYMSPEIMNHESYNSATDIWSLGCVVYEMFMLKKAFESTGYAELSRKITNCEFLLPNFENELEIKFIIENSLCKKAVERLSAREILQKCKENIHSEALMKAMKFFDDGEQLLENFKYKEALKCFEKSLVLKETLNASDRIEISSTMDKIGQCHLLLFECDDAINLCNQAYEMRKDFAHNLDSIHVFNSLISLGDCYSNTGKIARNLTKALKFYKDAHEMIQRLKLDSSRVELAKALGRIGQCYQFLKEFDKSLEFNLKSLKMYQEIYKNKDNKDLAKALNQVGISHLWIDDQNAALEFNMKALEMRQRLFGNADHIDIARSFLDLGSVHFQLNNTDKALKYFTDSLEMYKQVYGALQDHPLISSCLNNIGCLYGKMEKYRQAADYLTKSYEMNNRLFKDQSDVNIHRTLVNLANTYDSLNDEENQFKYQKLADDMEKRLK